MVTLLRAKGMRATPQRLAVLEAVRTSGEHLCAEQVYERVRETLPHISLATVYKALNELREIGKVRALPVSGKLRFDVDEGVEHHHLICERCSRVLDVNAGEAFQIPQLPEAYRGGFEVYRTQVNFRGLCPRCKAKERTDVLAAS